MQLGIEALFEPWGDIAPDGKTLVYATIGQELFLIGADGTGERALSGGTNDYAPVWSPNGRELAFISAREFNQHGHCAYVMNVATGACRRLMDSDRNNLESHVLWSPDGSRLAIKGAFKRSVRVVSAKGGASWEAAATASELIDWLPGSAYLLLGFWEEGARGIWIYPASAGGTPALPEQKDVPMPGRFCRNSLSPDGRHLLFLTGSATHASISVLDRLTRKVMQLTSGEASASQPSWSADGKKIAFVQSGGIHVMCADGSQKRSITPLGGYYDYPRWLPNGKKIVFVGHSTQGYDLYAADTDQGKIQKLTKNGGVGRRYSMFR